MSTHDNRPRKQWNKYKFGYSLFVTEFFLSKQKNVLTCSSKFLADVISLSDRETPRNRCSGTRGQGGVQSVNVKTQVNRLHSPKDENSVLKIYLTHLHWFFISWAIWIDYACIVGEITLHVAYAILWDLQRISFLNDIWYRPPNLQPITLDLPLGSNPADSGIYCTYSGSR